MSGDSVRHGCDIYSPDTRGFDHIESKIYFFLAIGRYLPYLASMELNEHNKRQWQAGQVEAALALAFGVDAAQAKALRARIQYLRKNGLPGVSGGGSGKFVAFTRMQVIELAVAIELQALGLVPSAVLKVVPRLCGDASLKVIAMGAATDGPDPRWIVYAPPVLPTSNPHVIITAERDKSGAATFPWGVVQSWTEQFGRVAVSEIASRIVATFDNLSKSSPPPRGPKQKTLGIEYPNHQRRDGADPLIGDNKNGSQ
ncbi:hypothetical protein HH303_18315 [Rhodospirillaceae bacterium KN72]|uniref:Uncharacterized protein n=1 Tax=Pacificispira spongiicola TaxID=2729598 RepID=A0A7Y0E3C5_9PROT|nr:hypothetical protein [Pacificispira spongiicola]NMM46451.1 hypothetical protein [Pacificispira spongiicola]